MAPQSGPESEMADDELVRKIAAGDEGALAVIYDRYSGVVYSLLFRMLKRPDVAEEVLQEVFFQLWRAAGRFDPERGALPSWLLVSARNRAISRLRRRETSEASGPAGSESSFPFKVESEMVRSRLVAEVRAAFESLPAPQRRALELAYFEGLTQSEISERTGEPLGTVKTRLRAGLEVLRQKFNS